VHLAIAKAVSKSIVNLRHNHALAHMEATSEICTQLVASLGRYKRPPAVPKIRNKKFLCSPNRLGWISLFAQNVTRGWIADRASEARGDERVKTVLRERHLPAETFECEQARAREQAEVAALDPYQFAGKKCRPRVEPDSGDAFGEREPLEAQSLDTLDSERLALVRREIGGLEPDDRDFFEGYISTWHERGIRHTPAERKRFERILTSLRMALVTQT
jgi:hypothetical protein